MARAGIWYTDNVSIEDTVIEAPKNIRKADGVTLKNVSFPNAAETLWNCNNVTMENVFAKEIILPSTPTISRQTISRLSEIIHSTEQRTWSFATLSSSPRTLSNTDNVTVYDSFISGEYLGWNAKNLTLINCTIESLQGMCYIDNLVMKNCKLINTTLAFEYSSVDAEITSGITSVLNPSSGTIKADYIDTLIIQKDYIDEGKTKLVCGDIRNKTDEIAW